MQPVTLSLFFTFTAMKVPVVTGHQHIDQHSQHGSLVATHTESLQGLLMLVK